MPIHIKPHKNHWVGSLSTWLFRVFAPLESSIRPKIHLISYKTHSFSLPLCCRWTHRVFKVVLDFFYLKSLFLSWACKCVELVVLLILLLYLIFFSFYINLRRRRHRLHFCRQKPITINSFFNVNSVYCISPRQQRNRNERKMHQTQRYWCDIVNFSYRNVAT